MRGVLSYARTGHSIANAQRGKTSTNDVTCQYQRCDMSVASTNDVTCQYRVRHSTRVGRYG
eukprot:3545038-Rhodomonas_salina.3